MMLALSLLACCLAVPNEVTVDTDSITLGDLIQFSGSDARRSLSLGYAPNPGLARRIARHEILAKLQNSSLPANDLELPDTILVRRSSQRLDPERVRTTILELFQQRFREGRVEIAEMEEPVVEVAAGALTLSGSLPARFDPAGPVSVRLDVLGPRFSRSLFVRTRVRIEVLQPVLRSAIPANSAVRPEDVSWELTPLEGRAVVMTSLEALPGMLAKRDLEPGQILKQDLLYTPLLVRTGESVTVRASVGGVTVAATMRARSSGHFGDTVVVEHLGATGTAIARVIGPRTLEATLGEK